MSKYHNFADKPLRFCRRGGPGGSKNHNISWTSYMEASPNGLMSPGGALHNFVGSPGPASGDGWLKKLLSGGSIGRIIKLVARIINKYPGEPNMGPHSLL